MPLVIVRGRMQKHDRSCLVVHVLVQIHTTGYGLTETSPVATIVPRGQMGKKRGSVGIPLPNSEIQVK